MQVNYYFYLELNINVLLIFWVIGNNTPQTLANLLVTP